MLLTDPKQHKSVGPKTHFQSTQINTQDRQFYDSISKLLALIAPPPASPRRQLFRRRRRRFVSQTLLQMAVPGLGCGLASAPSMVMPFNPFQSRGPTRPRVSVSHSMVSVARHRIPRTKLSLFVSVAGGLRSVPSLRVSAASTRFLSNEPNSYHVINPLQSKRKTSSTVVQFFKFKYPPMTKKPEWYWRFLAALPYLIPIHETWQHAETAYHLVPFLETFELLTMPFYRALSRFPVWIFFVYFICAYIFVVRKTMLPHFLRFHVMMGMLVSITMHIFGEMWKSLPISLYWGKAGAHFWTAVAFGHLLTCLVCWGCALNGKYADVPGLADAAYMQMSYG